MIGIDRKAVSEATRKVIAVLSGELEPIENSFPNCNEKGSADQLAWRAVTIGQWQSWSDKYWRGEPFPRGEPFTVTR